MSEQNGAAGPQQISTTLKVAMARFAPPQDAPPEPLQASIVTPKIKPMRPVAQAQDGIDYGGMTCAELCDYVNETLYYVPGMLAADQPCVIAGSVKTLKTLTTLDLALSLATATPVFGSLPVPNPVSVVMMTGESGLSVIRRKFITMCAARGLDPRAPEGLIIAPKLPLFGDHRHADALGKFIERHKAQVLIVDPTYLCMPGAEPGNVFAQGKLLGGMNTICAERGCTLAIIHHMRHVGTVPNAVPELGDIAWTGFAEWARQWILVGRREKYVSESGQHKLWLNCGGSAGHQMLRAVDIDEGTPADLRWIVELRRADEARQLQQEDNAAKRERDKAGAAERALAKLLVAAAEFPAGETKSTLKAAAGFSGESSKQFDAALAAAIERGDLVRCKIKKHTAHYDAYKPA